MSDVIVEGYVNLPIRLKVSGVSKKEFDTLSEIEKQRLLQEAHIQCKGSYTHGIRIVHTYAED